MAFITTTDAKDNVLRINVSQICYYAPSGALSFKTVMYMVSLAEPLELKLTPDEIEGLIGDARTDNPS